RGEDQLAVRDRERALAETALAPELLALEIDALQHLVVEPEELAVPGDAAAHLVAHHLALPHDLRRGAAELDQRAAVVVPGGDEHALVEHERRHRVDVVARLPGRERELAA